MRIKSKFAAEGEQSEEMSLQITSMADIFTIILVFLLKSYSTSLVTVAPSQDVLLPEAQAEPHEAKVPDALKIEILRDTVLVDQKPTVKLKNFVLAESPPVDLVYQSLLGQRKKMIGNMTDSHLLVLADRRTPYATIKQVMASAANAGFVDLQLAVVEPNE